MRQIDELVLVLVAQEDIKIFLSEMTNFCSSSENLREKGSCKWKQAVKFSSFFPSITRKKYVHKRWKFSWPKMILFWQICWRICAGSIRLRSFMAHN